MGKNQTSRREKLNVTGKIKRHGKKFKAAGKENVKGKIKRHGKN
jgi:hypothetical protein